MASRSIDDLSAQVKARALLFQAECKARGFEVLIYCTLRSNAEQDDLYASGRTKNGPVLTCARAGQSLHNPDEHGKAWAFDAVPVLAGKPQWDNLDLLNAMGMAGEAVGLFWAGRWSGKLRERVHFQMTRATLTRAESVVP